MGKTISYDFYDKSIAQKAMNDLFNAYEKRNQPCVVSIEKIEEK
jgi:hypothetical protein